MNAILAVAGITLAASFLCSIFEATLYAITPSQLELLKQKGSRGAERLAKLRDNVEEPIAAILTINTIAHTIGSAWCGAMGGEKMGSKAVGIFAAVFTLLVLALTEIVPKSIGVRYASQLGPHFAFPIQIMIWMAWPIARPAKWVMGLMTGKGGEAGPSEDEVILFSNLALQHGAVRRDEHRWMQNALRLDRVTAQDLRTPRTVVDTLPADTLISELTDLATRWVHSRVPLTDGDDADEIVGMAFRRDVFDAVISPKDTSAVTLRDLMKPIRFVPETMPAHELLDLFIDQHQHMVAVADEYGGFEGVVTLEDVLECMLGAEIVDEHDRIENMQALARQQNRFSDADEDAEAQTDEKAEA